MIAWILNNVATIDLAISLITLAGGAYAYWRSNCRAFNAAAEPYRTALKRQRVEVTPNADMLDGMVLLDEHMPIIRRGRFREAVRRYTSARQDRQAQEQAYGTFEYTDTAHIKSAIDNILPYLKRR